ncbi:SusD/RagB family nutrient-binding outer membrane lipoprotein [Bacteroides thetaiotaomicron]|nr:SusD/RagB family nutrient-binding outer membrane lipoprotein [Bacteroides thetaiotaomicron]MCS2850452.1 SusD/RagB family nutrient-binding outer membrane lipoprotein [Bacteroides thetaiotaomicron]
MANLLMLRIAVRVHFYRMRLC